MRRLVFVLFCAVALIALTVVAASAASPPLEIHFDVETNIVPDGPSYGPFTATGPAVDAGLVCPYGETIDVWGQATGGQSGRGLNVQVVKEFTCSDGTGQFYVKLQVRIDQKGDNANWNIMGGNEAYAKLHGTGKLEGIAQDYGVLDLYDGKVHVD